MYRIMSVSKINHAYLREVVLCTYLKIREVHVYIQTGADSVGMGGGGGGGGGWISADWHCPEYKSWHFIHWRQFAWNVKILFSGKNKEKYFKMLCAEIFTQNAKR